MHSIVILGDNRHHVIVGNSPLPARSTIFGGIHLIRNAIDAMFNASSSLSPPTLCSPDEHPGTNLPTPYANETEEMLRWQIEERPCEGLAGKRYCLTNRSNYGRVCLPEIPDDLLNKIITGRFNSRKPLEISQQIFLDKLGSKGFFTKLDKTPLEESGELRKELDDYLQTILNRYKKSINPKKLSEQAAPDVVIFDDLGLQAGEIKFPSPKNCPLKDPKKFLVEIGRPYWKNLVVSAKNEKDFIGQGNLDAFLRLYESKKHLTKIAMQGLVGRLLADAKKLNGVGNRHPIEPVLIFSVANCLPKLCPDAGKNNSPTTIDTEEKTFWQHIFENDALRRRTVVIFDAETIRREISVSSGLSWERTAQDTIVEFKRSKNLRPFLRFGHVVIRFGLTGMILISNNKESDWTYTLYFHPDQDDVAWTHSSDGKVLGATAITIATIVEQLDNRCSWRDGEAVLHDLSATLDQALLLSVLRLQTHYELGNGKDEDAVINCLRKKLWFDTKVFSTRSQLLRENPARVSVQRVGLLPFRSPHWSILAQSCQTDLNNVARSIVFHGPKITFNTLDNPVHDFVTGMLHEVSVKLENYSKDYGRRNSFFLESKLPNKYFSSEDSDTNQLHTHILKSIQEEMDGDLQGNLRRLLGNSFYYSIVEFKKNIGRDVELKNTSKLLAVINELPSNTAKLDSLLSSGKNSLAVILRASFEQSKTSQLIKHLKNQSKATDAELLYLHLLEGRENFIQEVHKTNGIDPSRVSDQFIRTTYGHLRDSIRSGLAMPKSSGNKEAAFSILERIEHENLVDPHAFLNKAIIELIRAHEPCHGWSSPISTPVLRLGKIPGNSEKDKRLAVVDRKEVEGIRAVKRMINQFLSDIRDPLIRKKPDRPLSIAVFGPPGSGKSIAVKKIIESIDSEKSFTTQKTINLGQLSGVKEFSDKFTKIVQKSGDMIPIIFFDEFDSALTEPLGWLKYFLAVMEDGEFGDLLVKKAVLVFAGGTCNTFEEFSLANRSRTDPLWADFSSKKGPDFVSRLSEHINVVGINPSSPDDDLYLIRRALALRFLIDEHQDLGDSALALIDKNMVNAFLHVPNYIHGIRSMRMLLELCISRDQKNTIAMSEVPPIHQLDMQVDGKAFAALASGQTQPVLT